MVMKALWIYGFVIVLAISTGCATDLLTGYNYYVTVKNTGQEPITDSTVISAKGFWMNLVI